MDDRLALVVGPASLHLGTEVGEILRIAPRTCDCLRFPDGEVQVDLKESVRGQDVFVLQSTSPPVEQHLMELLLLADACRRGGAGRLTAVIPYFGYARQDRRRGRSAIGARVAADVLATGGFDRIILIDAHTPSIEASFGMPIDHLTAVPLLARVAAPGIGDDSVIVAPDLGAVKLAREYARRLQAPIAFVHKTRLTGEAVETQGVIGDVRGRRPLIVDDMLSTGATVEAAIVALRAAGAVEPVSVAVTHALLVGRAHELLPTLPIARLIATNTVTQARPGPPSLEIASVAPLVATAIGRDHHHESLFDLRKPE